MRILYICSADLSGTLGSEGSVRHIMEVSENLCRRGHSVTLLAPGYTHYRHPTPVRIVYVPLIDIRFLRTIMSELLAPFFMAWLFLSFKPEIVYWRQSYLTVFPVLLSRLCGRHIVTEVNGLTLDEIESEPLHPARKKVILLIERFNYLLSSKLICVAPKIRDCIVSHYRLKPQSVAVILNGVNADRMTQMDTAEAKKTIGIDPEVKAVGFVGHLFPWDGVEHLIESAAKVIQKIPHVKFVIVGHGKWGTHLADLVEQKNLADYFMFTGKVPWENLYRYVNAFDIATAPYSKTINTRSGRSSLKILEYFACEKPVVASETSVIPEIVDLQEKGFGVTVPSENPEALADALIALLKDEALRAKMGKGGREYVLRERSWTIVAQKTEEILSSMKARVPTNIS